MLYVSSSDFSNPRRKLKDTMKLIYSNNYKACSWAGMHEFITNERFDVTWWASSHFWRLSMSNIKLTIWKNFWRTEKRITVNTKKGDTKAPILKCVFTGVQAGVCNPPARRRELGCRLLAWRCPSHFGESPRRIRGHRYNSCGGTLTPGDSSRSETCPPLPGSSDPSQDALVTEEKKKENQRPC